MNELNIEEVCAYVNENIDRFHQHRVEIISRLSLKQLIQKNPYLFRAKNISKAAELIEGTLEAFLSSSEEQQFGAFLEELAIFIASRTCNGHKSSAPGMDLEFDADEYHYIVSIKSGPNWGNSSQHSQLTQDFITAEKRLRQHPQYKAFRKVLGICYGKARSVFTDQGYYKIVGQNFWTLISGDQNLYIDIVEPIGFRAREHNEVYVIERDKITNLLTKRFIDEFCEADGSIDWARLLKANSGNYDLDQTLR